MVKGVCGYADALLEREMGKLKFTPKNIVLAAFAAVETVIYIVFNIVTAIIPGDTIYLKYSGILLCLAVAFTMIFFNGKSRDSVILTCALFFTAVSDLFILVLNKYYEVGLITFIITQSLYLYRLYAGRIKKIWITVTVRAVAAATLLSVFGGLGKLNFLVAEVCVYIVMLVGNCADAWIIAGKGVKNVIFALGLVLFLCCDICVGLDNAGAVIGLKLPVGLILFTQTAIWAFYLPSQVLITCTGKRCALSEREGKDERKVEKGA